MGYLNFLLIRFSLRFVVFGFNPAPKINYTHIRICRNCKTARGEAQFIVCMRPRPTAPREAEAGLVARGGGEAHRSRWATGLTIMRLGCQPCGLVVQGWLPASHLREFFFFCNLHMLCARQIASRPMRLNSL